MLILVNRLLTWVGHLRAPSALELAGTLNVAALAVLALAPSPVWVPVGVALFLVAVVVFAAGWRCR